MTATVSAGALKGTLTCQQIDDSEDEGGPDADEFDDSLGAEEALVEAAADVLPPLAKSLGTAAFMDAWRVCIGPALLWLCPWMCMDGHYRVLWEHKCMCFSTWFQVLGGLGGVLARLMMCWF